MSSPSVKLYRLRGIFVVYFVVKSVVGAVVAARFLRPLASGRHGFGLRVWPAGAMAFFGLVMAAVVLLVAWLVFGELLRRRNWARVLLLVIGWLAVAGAVFTLLSASQAGDLTGWLSRWIPGLDLDWERLMHFDRVQKVFELLFWGYLISVLQFDPGVKKEFLAPPPAAGAGK
jgi:hypothetical protein